MLLSLLRDNRLKFTYGFTTKTVKGKQYVYFWRYTGSGRKTETYIGRAGKLKTQRRALQTKLAYLEGLEQELCEMIRQTRQELEGLPANSSDVGKPGFHGKNRGRRTTKDAVDGSEDQRDEDKRAKA